MTDTTLPIGSTPQAPTPPPPQDLYAKRKQIYPKKIDGTFRRLKWFLLIGLLAVYYIVPWIRWPRGEGIPDQAVLADFAGEKFYFFWIEIWPQEVHYLAGLMIFSALGLFLVTALFGRVWCGYFCPQTVWTDLFIWVERKFEGDRAERMRRDKQGLTPATFLRKFGKHIVWLIIAFWTGGAFILYFHDAPTLAMGWFTGEAPLTAYFFAGVLTFTTYTLAGMMREQVCTYLCPWPRIQGALTDEHALNVTYRWPYGEPRAPKRKGDSWEDRGGCIDCDQCVQVCPMGIDIRDGEQLECIHCGLCIDACDDMMEKIGWPKRLIGYDTQGALAQRAEGVKPRYNIFRPRVLMYAFLMVLVGGLTLYGLGNRTTFELNVLKDRSPPFVMLSSGEVQNGYAVKLVNKANETREMTLSVSGVEGISMDIAGLDVETGNSITLPIEAHGVDRFRMVLRAPEGWDGVTTRVNVTVTEPVSGESQTNSVSFQGPASQ